MVTYDSTPAAATELSTLSELVDIINGVAGLSAEIGGAETDATVVITGDDQSQDLVITNVTGTPATDLGIVGTAVATYDPATSALNMSSGTITADFARSVQIFDSQGSARTLTFSFLKRGIPNEWFTEVHIEPASPVTTAAPLIDGHIATGTTAFNANGSIDLGSTSATLTAALNIPWSAELGVDAQSITLDLGSDGTTEGLSQFASDSALISTSVNGALFGTLVSVTINDQGVVIANFDNGELRELFKLPIAVFPNITGCRRRPATPTSRPMPPAISTSRRQASAAPGWSRGGPRGLDRRHRRRVHEHDPHAARVQREWPHHHHDR